MFALVDGNNFYASCERVFNPALRDKAIVVLSNNDGIVIARSNEAKALGIKMGTPTFEIKDLIATQKVLAFSSNFALYGDMSRRMMHIFKDFTPDIEVYSIDEAFLDFSGFNNTDLKRTGTVLRKKVLKYIGIPVSVGFGPSKTLAKIANRIAKKYMTNGVALIDTPDKIERALKMTPIEDVWGIGRRYSRFLQDHGVKTAWDFTRMPDTFIRKNMSVNGLRTKQELLGISCIPMSFVPEPRKAIRTARTFAQTKSTYDDVAEAVSSFAVACARKLREQGSAANLVTVFVRTNKFDKKNPYYANSFTLQVNATSSSIDLIKAAKLALKYIFKEGMFYKKAGVMVSGLIPERHRQLSLFEGQNLEKHNRLMQAIDRLNNRAGINVVRFAAEGNFALLHTAKKHPVSSKTICWFNAKHYQSYVYVLKS